ncbi:MAG: toprim domain-containing protein [Pseudomonadota bacterium]
MSEVRTPRLGMADVKPLFQQRAFDLARGFFPNGKSHGGYWQANDPAGGHDNLTIWLKGGAAGAFKAWASEARGDIFDLVVFAGQARDRKEALAFAKGYLGLDNAPPAKVEAVKAEAREVERAQKAQAAARDRSRMKYAKSVWLEAAPLERGDKAWIYLETAREIPIGWLDKKKPIGAIRCHPALKYRWPEISAVEDGLKPYRPKTGESVHPAMVASMAPIIGKTETERVAGGIHRTYLARDGVGKAIVPEAKRMMGPIGGCAVKIWRGDSGLSERAAIEKGLSEPVVVCEGIEDALSIAVSVPEHRIWALGSLSNLRSMAWPAVASEIVIFADNDWDKPGPQQLLERAVDRLSAMGPVRLTRAAGDGVKDANDLLKQRRR